MLACHHRRALLGWQRVQLLLGHCRGSVGVDEELAEQYRDRGCVERRLSRTSTWRSPGCATGLSTSVNPLIPLGPCSS